MNFKRWVAIPLLGLLAMGVSTCDKVEQVDDPISDIQARDIADDGCNIFMIGKVIDAKTRAGIEKAEVQINSSKVFTDQNGNFRIEIGDGESTPGPELVKVSKDNFVFSTFEFDVKNMLGPDRCFKGGWEILADFVLTPQKAAIQLKPEGGIISFKDTIVLLQPSGELVTSILDYEVEVPAGAVSVPTDVKLTPIHPEQTLGRRPQEMPLKSFDLQPAGLSLQKPLVVRFAPDFAVSATNKLVNYQYQDETNLWLSFDRAVTFLEAVNQVEAKIQQAGKYLITNSSTGFAIQKDELAEGIHALEYSNSMENCNCGNMMVYDEKFDWPVDYWQTSGPVAPVHRILNLPISYIKKEKQETGVWGKAKKCMVELIEGFTNTRYITVQIGGTAYKIHANILVRVVKTRTKCSVTTPCHQGCPS